ncbi:CCA tRNA nucleotidyltransferase [Cypionkella sp.]|uniref:CCA tRNA nucleotidyltransferase n=1 Tax=Cypionkella sp. TaxID=2811411 RepID=UPI00272260F6|nr:CCA tRNA nucleotidyltransferase [Cypionkella sp.]MDO8984964.1 CCA tRNA nucleotidyltransferase [Cypionkella sp.]MDP2049048.1 CCA tRNA nucleotidyltransferase [Cypionkella sp.]
MKISDDWIGHPGTQALCKVLAQAGCQALFVGGCVRNSLLGVPVADIDIATNARPEIVSNLAETAGFRVVPTGIEHGTVTVIAQGLAHEVTTFRRDVETDGRRAVVAFSSDVVEDAARRDFTMNALYARADGSVLDPLGGLPDLIARRVRFVGEPQARIREDYLRILRFFRFYAVYGDPEGGIDAEGLAACAGNADGINGLSRERVGAEMRKLLGARDPAPAIAAMAQTGILAKVLPGSDAKALCILVHLEGDEPPRWQRRLAILGGADPGRALRLSRTEIGSNAAVRAEIGSPLTSAALGWKLGAEAASDVLLCRAALFETHLPRNWQAEIARGVASTIPVTAADLMPALRGRALGKKLHEIQARWLASDLYLRKSDLLA